jgi:hypothetical protein
VAVERAFDGDAKQFVVQVRDVFAKAAPDIREVNELAAVFAEDRAAALVRGIDEDQRRSVQRIIKRAIEQGWTDQQVGQKIARVVGLHERYEIAVHNYEMGLRAKGLPGGRARQMADRYAKRLRHQRADGIAKYEIQKALNDAQRVLWEQQKEAGELPGWVTRRLVVHKDERLCPICRPLNGRRAAIGKGGGYDVPQLGRKEGPPFHPNCRCYEAVEAEVVEKGVDVPATQHVTSLDDTFKCRELLERRRTL